ncbi:hypothetical protein [Indiicoccus explosivorum]|uniref:hypothetical protein n=1 Tax=Indiicoccus explosivorum TaxID=1917864 RepID=UPI000B441659|nr:hypothetical protein [Indiicoccus explosivorum]
MIKNKWIKAGATGLLSMSVLAACAEEEPVEEEVVEEEPVEEEAVEEEVVEEEPIEEDGADEVAEAVDFGNISEEELQTTYLDPLGWDAQEFEDFLNEEYDMGLADFGDFSELEGTVGPAADIEAVLE